MGMGKGNGKGDSLSTSHDSSLPDLATFRSVCLENGRAARMMGRYIGADCPD